MAMEAKEIGKISPIAIAANVSRNTVKKGIFEVESGELYVPGSRIRAKGAGNKFIKDTDPTIIADLESLTDPKGDPMSLVRWTTKSVAHLVEALAKLGHTVKPSALYRLMVSLGYSLKANKKNIEGVSHIDRDAQFIHINKSCKDFETLGDPIISVDCKKKELIGNFKNNGSEWQSKGQNEVVNVYDFKSLADGKAVPYGVYDVLKNTGFVNVGIDHDTASFAVESIRRWWHNVGIELYPDKKDLLITSDGGGSNGVRVRLWKKELQQFANESGLSITVNHLPPATSKWNKIEHKLFSFISINWRAKPLTSLETIIELISHTTTKEGLVVKAIVDKNIYPTKIKVTDKEMSQLNIQRDIFHPEWNYIIKPMDVTS
ncbi:MAG: ISAzo13 family transposase [Bacillota bacterium]